MCAIQCDQVQQSPYTPTSVDRKVGLNKHKILLFVRRVGFMFYAVNQGHVADPLWRILKVLALHFTYNQ
jgi:hypothetical protein